MDVASGIDRTDRTEIYFRLQIQGNRKLIPCFRSFYPARAARAGVK